MVRTRLENLGCHALVFIGFPYAGSVPTIEAAAATVFGMFPEAQSAVTVLGVSAELRARL